MKHLKENERLVLTTTMFDAGIVPITDTGHDVNRALCQVNAEDARKMKRKFRKLWRREAKKRTRKQLSGVTTNAPPDPERVKRQMEMKYGAGKLKPSRNDREARKRLVVEGFMEARVRPLLEAWEKKL